MKRAENCFWVVVCLMGWFGPAWAQQKPEREEVPRAQRALTAAPDRVRTDESTISPEGLGALAQAVPRLVKFSGAVKDSAGRPLTGVVGATFSIYRDQEGGAPLWMETQNVQLDDQGRFTVLLGATKSEGIPMELFNAAESRWLGVQGQGMEEPARVLLVSVPYALRAADADTVGGLPASAFMLATASGIVSSSSVPGTTTQTSANETPAKIAPTRTANTKTATAALGPPAANFIPVFTGPSATSLGSSVMFQDPSNNFIGLGTTTPDSHLHIQGFGPDVVFNFQNAGSGGHAFRFDATNNNSAFGGGKLVMQDLNAGGVARFTIDSNGFVGLGTASPDSHLHIQGSEPDVVFNFQNAGPGGHAFRFDSTNNNSGFGGGKLVVQDLNVGGAARFTIDPNGLVGIGTAAPGQKLEVAGNIKISGAGNALVFPDGTVVTSAGAGTNGGTITSVTAGTGLSGGGTAGGVTLSNTGVLSFNGRPGMVTPTMGDYSFSQISGAATSAQLPAASLVRAITYLAGCDSCSLLTNADSQNTIFVNVIGGMTINSVTCFSDAGAPTVSIELNHGGTLSNVLSSNLTCSTMGATSSSFSTSALSLNDSLNFILVADGVAKRVTTIIKATLN
jgi:hypothetical protein